MIGMDFPIKPEWVYAVHHLWQPEQPISDLVQIALVETMQELGGEKTRRNSLSILLRNFVEMEGGGRSRQTLSRDPWVTFSRSNTISTMKPAYLAQIIAHNDVATEITKYVAHRFQPDDIARGTDIRQYLIANFGERKVVLNSASAFLKTLIYFDVLSEGEKKGEYVYKSTLPVTSHVFPLIVWSIWRANPSPQLDLEEFDNQAANLLLDYPDDQNFWSSYQPALWVLSERIGLRQVTLKITTDEDWQEKLLDFIP